MGITILKICFKIKLNQVVNKKNKWKYWIRILLIYLRSKKILFKKKKNKTVKNQMTICIKLIKMKN